MTKIYQGARITEYHLNSGQILTLNEEEFNELFEIEGTDISFEELQEGYDLSKLCEERLTESDIEESLIDFLQEIIDKLSLYQNEDGILPSLDTILLRYEDEESELKENLHKKDILIEYLREWIKDEN